MKEPKKTPKMSEKVKEVVDAFTGATIINTATYKVTPSWELSGEG